MKSKNREIFTYTAIIALQVMVLLYWANVKTNFFIDELYSMGYASSFTGAGDTARYITTSPDWQFDEWIENSVFKKYLLVSDEESVFRLPFLKAVQKFITGRNYFGLLNIAESVAGYSFVSARPGILLNIIIYVCAEISLISLLKKLNMDRYMRALALVMFGFSCYMISAAIFIRFYIFVILLMLLTLNLFYKLWSAEKWKQIIPEGIGIMFLAYFAYKNSELTIAFFGAFIGSFVIASFLAKKWKQFFAGIAMCLCGMIFIGVTTEYISIFSHPDDYLTIKNANVAAEIGYSIANATLASMMSYLAWLANLFGTSYFGSFWTIFLFMGAVTICLILVSEKTEKKLLHFRLKKIRPLTAGAFIVWLVLLSAARRFGYGPYFFCLAILCLIALLAIKEAADFKLDFKKISFSPNTLFILVLISATVIYTIFEMMAGLNTWRYYCYGFVSATIIIWYVADRLLKMPFLKWTKKQLKMILLVFVVINALIPFKTGNIEYIYEDDKDFVDNIWYHREMDVVLFVGVNNENGTISRHDTYDCINLMSESANIYITEIGKYEYDKMDYPDEFLLWSSCTSDIDLILGDLYDHGYQLRELGSDHISKAFVCKLR